MEVWGALCPPELRCWLFPTGRLVTAVEKFEAAAEALEQHRSALQKGSPE